MNKSLYISLRLAVFLSLHVVFSGHPISTWNDSLATAGEPLFEHKERLSITKRATHKAPANTERAFTSSLHDSSELFFSKSSQQSSFNEDVHSTARGDLSSPSFTSNVKSTNNPDDHKLHAVSRTVKNDRASGKETKPFFVEIEKEHFYGGLVTYSHEQHPAQICRVMNACARRDGTLVLPQWMRRHDTTLSFHCGQTKLDFSLPDDQPPPALVQGDLVGLKRPRPSMPDFLQDFLPSAVVFDLIYGDHQVSKTCHSRQGKNCEPFPGLVQDFRPVVQLHPRLQEFDEKQSWVREFVKLMKPPNRGRQAKVVYELAAEENSESDMQCFRSAFFTRGPYNKSLITKDHLSDIHFLRLNGIKKKARKFLRSSESDDDKKPSCTLNVTLSNRKLIDGANNRLIGRYVMNIPALRVAIERQAKKVPGLQLYVDTMTLEGRSLRWQINGMLKSDIWVAPSGPLLTNMLFLRENSTLIEIQPFAYYPQTYEKMAQRLAYVHYERYIAHPDKEGFEACLHYKYPESHRSYKKAQEFLAKFSKAAEKYFQSDSTHTITLQNFNDTSIRHVKTCAQMQRLDTTAKNLAIAVVRHARLRCGLPKPNLRKIEEDK